MRAKGTATSDHAFNNFWDIAHSSHTAKTRIKSREQARKVAKQEQEQLQQAQSTAEEEF